MTFKSFSKYFGNNQGMSMPLVMILSVVGGLIVLALSNTMVNAAGLMGSRNQVTSYKSFVENLKNVMEDPAACTEMLEGIVINTNLVGGPTQIAAIDSDFNEPPKTASELFATPDANIKRGWQSPEKNFGIDRMEVELLGDSVSRRSQRDFHQADYTNPAAVAPDVLEAYPARFVFHPSGIGSKVLRESESVDDRFEDKDDLTKEVTGKTWDFEDLSVDPLEYGRIDIRLFLNVQPIAPNQAVIRSCYGYNSIASVCAASGGTYQYKAESGDPFPTYKCKPMKKCFQSPDGLVDSPSMCKAPYNQKGPDGAPLFTDAVGAKDGKLKYLCNWCHPFPTDEDGKDKKTGGISKTFDQLRDEWIALANKVADVMPFVPDPLNPVDPYDKMVYKYATEWTYLENLTKELGYMQDTTSAEYLAAKALADAYDAVKDDLFMKSGEVMNLEAEVDDLKDEVEAANLAKFKYGLGGVSDADLASLQKKVDAAQAAYDADPSSANQIALEDAQSEYDSAKAYKDDPNLAKTLEGQLATKEAELKTAKSEEKQLQSDLADAQAAKDAMVLSTGQTVDEFLNPIEQIKQDLVDEYGLDPAIIEFMDAVRGF